MKNKDVHFQNLVDAIQKLRASGSLEQVIETIDLSLYALFLKNNFSREVRDSIICTIMNVKKVLKIVYSNRYYVVEDILSTYFYGENQAQDLKILYSEFLGSDFSDDAKDRLNIYNRFDSLKEIFTVRDKIINKERKENIKELVH